jgi:hypothetical protein
VHNSLLPSDEIYRPISLRVTSEERIQFTKWLLLGTTLLLASPIFATTYSGGFEDWNSPASDYDYNDMVFSISGAGLTLQTSKGVWFDKADAGVLNKSFGAATNGSPFWNNPSNDGSGGYNVGFCIYGGGVCNKGVGLAPSAEYLAAKNSKSSVNDVSFSVDGSVNEQVYLSITSGSDSLGWELLSGGPIHFFGSGTQGPVSFAPTGEFVLVGQQGSNGAYLSDVAASDDRSHFAFFVTPTPEPASIGLFGIALAAGLLVMRKRLVAA